MPQIRLGDVYCPRCLSQQLAFTATQDGFDWECQDRLCGHRWDWSYDEQAMDWVWPEGQRPTPGCPWCGTCNIRCLIGDPWGSSDHWDWVCRRQACERRWLGRFTRNTATGVTRWLIRIPTRLVPFTWLADDGAPLVRWGAGTIPR
ncbi:MAG: hypothetical protein LC792_00400 [Actinobacteria bacterium]|nr:hypothetical protein [Actinomycetota bacterium]